MIDKDGEFFRSKVNGKNLKSHYDNTGMFIHFKISIWVFRENYNLRGSNVGVLLVIFTSSIYILVFYTSIYAQFIYKLIFISGLSINQYSF